MTEVVVVTEPAPEPAPEPTPAPDAADDAEEAAEDAEEAAEEASDAAVDASSAADQAAGAAAAVSAALDDLRAELVLVRQQLDAIQQTASQPADVGPAVEPPQEPIEPAKLHWSHRMPRWFV